VGIFEEIVTTDTLGRRTGPRMRHTIEEKLRIVEETRAKGASVAAVARRHHVNPNQVFAWRRQHRSGLLNAQGAKGDAKMRNRSQQSVAPYTLDFSMFLVPQRGFEPLTHALRMRCSTNWAIAAFSKRAAF
jgi:Transposase